MNQQAKKRMAAAAGGFKPQAFQAVQAAKNREYTKKRAAKERTAARRTKDLQLKESSFWS
jgi:hypothetical protein